MNVTLMPPKLKLIYGKITDLVWYIFNLKKKTTEQAPQLYQNSFHN